MKIEKKLTLSTGMEGHALHRFQNDPIILMASLFFHGILKIEIYIYYIFNIKTVFLNKL